MSRAALVLRPEPGNAATAARLAAIGCAVRPCPLFAVRPVAWAAPDPAGYDALLLTSANAVRHATPALAALAALPALAVGQATARAAAAAGLDVVLTGSNDAVALARAARAGGWRRLLHLAGRPHRPIPGVDVVTVYTSEPLPIGPDEVAAWRDVAALLHSPRAARRFAALVDGAGLPRRGIAVAALSEAVATAAGKGWKALATAPAPRDDLLVSTAAALIDRLGGAADKRA